MNKTRIIVVIGVAVILALLASVGTYRFLSEKGRVAEEARLQTAGVVVAVTAIPLAATIHPSQVALVRWPKENLPKDAFSDPKLVLTRVARRDFLPGEPIVESKLVPADKSSGIMSLKVPEGMRAFSIHVNEVVGVGGFIVPDARVDVVLTTASPLGGQVSKIVLEDIRVLAAGQTSEQKENKPITVNTVTLAVTPEDAEKLALASNDGKIQLVLRNFMDNTVVSTPGIDKHRLLASHRFDPPAQAEKAPARPKRSARAKASPDASGSPSPGPKGHVVEVIKGTKRSAETFE